MKTENLDRNVEQNSNLKMAGLVAGIAFLFNLLIPTLGFLFIQSQLFVASNPLETVEKVLNNKSLFRLGILSELILTIGLIILGYSLYMLVRHVNKTFARFAFILKLVEATIMTVVTLISFLALQLLLSSDILLNQGSDIKLMAGLIINQHSVINSIPMLFLGLEMVIFTVLLYKSELIPRSISVFGMIAFALIFIYGIISIIIPDSNIMLLTLPSFLFELVCGIWLLVKGISINKLAGA